MSYAAAMRCLNFFLKYTVSKNVSVWRPASEDYLLIHCEIGPTNWEMRASDRCEINSGCWDSLLPRFAVKPGRLALQPTSAPKRHPHSSATHVIVIAYPALVYSAITRANVVSTTQSMTVTLRSRNYVLFTLTGRIVLASQCRRHITLAKCVIAAATLVEFRSVRGNHYKQRYCWLKHACARAIYAAVSPDANAHISRPSCMHIHAWVYACVTRRWPRRTERCRVVYMCGPTWRHVHASTRHKSGLQTTVARIRAWLSVQWFIPFADKRVDMQVKLWDPLTRRAVPQCF